TGDPEMEEIALRGTSTSAPLPPGGGLGAGGWYPCCQSDTLPPQTRTRVLKLKKQKSLGRKMYAAPCSPTLRWDATPPILSHLPPHGCSTVGTSLPPLIPLARRLEAWLVDPDGPTRLRDSIHKVQGHLVHICPFGFYSPYFIVPKKKGGLLPILDLRVLNRSLYKMPFKMLTPKRIRHDDWFAAIDLKNAYFHVSILPRHRPFLWFAFEGQAYQYKALPFGLALSIYQIHGGYIRILNYLDDWLIVAHSRDLLCEHRDLVLQHLSLLGLQVNWEKSKLSPVQSISFLAIELDSVSMMARLTEERAQSVLSCLNLFRHSTVVPLKIFQRLLGHMAAAAAVTPLGLLHMRPLQHWLHGRIPRWVWHRGTFRVGVTPECRLLFNPWSDLAFLRAGVPLGQVRRHVIVNTDASRMGWGAVCNGQAASGSWTGPRLQWHINCLELLAEFLALRRFRLILRGEHVLVHTDNMATVAYINHQGGLRSRRMSHVATHPPSPLESEVAQIAGPLAYQCQGEPCPLGVRAHLTRSVASSHALAHGASQTDICRAAG
ncbi:hypothetical protein M9458_005300, partial [Cirrhinus mrigala]